ncbi:MAG: PQQ-binding-like beta-propeller repeat protein [Planctomycetaceae bacterium]|jgi:outer membrane protein assembly factor BamB|nr:PQQ-binding-like beta-propeller repeat protein [Planctomycetaceae bacterium]
MNRLIQYILIATAIFSALISIESSIMGDDWASFRGPTGDGASTANKLPLKWSATDNVTWKTAIKGQGWSSPVLRNGVLYITNAVSEDAELQTSYQLNAIAINSQTGKILWTTNVFTQPLDSPKIHSKNSHASPTPIVTATNVIVHFGHMGTACLNIKGDVVWKTVASKYSPVHGNGGTPILHDGKLYFSVDGKVKTLVICLDAATGDTVWEFDRQSSASRKFSFTTPAVIEVAGRLQLISPASDIVQAIDLHSGKLIWQVKYDGYSLIPKPVYHNGLLYICTGYNTPWLYCIDPTGQGDVTNSHVRWNIQRQIPHTPSLILNEGKLFMISDRGIGSCLNAVTGETIWQERIGGNYSASPIINNGNIYFTSEQGDTTIVKASEEYKVVSKNSMGQATLASFAVEEGVIYIRTDSHLYRVE